MPLIGLSEGLESTDQTVAAEENSRGEVSFEGSLLDDISARINAHIMERFSRAKTARLSYEQRWIKSWRNYRGFYSDDVKFLDTEKSRVFIKITKTKVMAAYQQLTDVLFSAGRFPIGVEPTRLPDGIAADVHYDPNSQSTEEVPEQMGPASPYGYAGDGKELPPGATANSLLGSLEQELGEAAAQVKEGVGTSPSAITFSPAEIASRKMEKKILDQLDESDAGKELRTTALEMVLYGSGAMKGPLALNKEYPKWNEEGQYEPLKKVIPTINSPSIWALYPDPDANNAGNWSYCVERHGLSRSKLRGLKNRPFFLEEAIERVIDQGYNYTPEWWEPIIKDLPSISQRELFMVLEYWGFLDRELAEEWGLTIPSEFDALDEIPVNCWICGNEVIRLVLNPFTPTRIPYYVVPYEIQPYTTWGIGLAENMEDSQELMNGFMRMAVDNAVLSGSLVFELNETWLSPGQDLTIYPGKVFRTNANAPGQTLFTHEFPNISQQNMQMFDKARMLADESTGVYSITHGNSDITPGLGRTSSGLSMLMGAAAGNIRTVVKNVDDYLLSPLGRALFAFNMQFDYDEEIKGDLEVVSRGTETLMRNEVRSQRLISFLQIAGGNPATAPFVKIPYILREIAKSLDLDPDKVTTNTNEIGQILAIMQQGQQPQGAPAGAPPQQGGSPPGPPTAAPPGGNTPGAAPPPGTPGFSGNTGQGTVGGVQGSNVSGKPF